jgi:DNA-binding NarL/FixJ family response regulator
MSGNTINISIVEDDREFQSWILEEIKEAAHINCLSTYDNGEDALAAIPQLKPDIVIMDLNLNNTEMDGIECMLRLKLVAPAIKFLVMTANNDESSLYDALSAGAGAYIQKGDIPRQLSDLIGEFYAGGAPMSSGIAKRIIENFHRQPEDIMQLKSLSTRENQTLELLSKGFLYKEVADRLTIAEGTVKQHAHNIYKKLQVNNCVEAIRKYLNF